MSAHQPIAVDIVGNADYTHTLSTISAELDSVTQSANSILSGNVDKLLKQPAKAA